jgi:hypothetical protein
MPQIVPRAKMTHNLFQTIRDQYWYQACLQAKQAGISQNGVYHPPSDIDAFCLYCMGEEL